MKALDRNDDTLRNGPPTTGEGDPTVSVSAAEAPTQSGTIYVSEDESAQRISGRATSVGTLRIPKSGDVISGVYRVLGELGRGGMGVVLAALDEQLQRQVAIKLIRDELLRPGFRELFLREARAMARVNHPNVLGIHAFGEHEEIPYFVMELVEGETLETWRAKQTITPSLDVKLAILNDVCSGVAAIHAAMTIHRDIKPSNILIDATLRARVADFGVATPDGSESKDVVGTPAYMAPEIALSGALGGGGPSPLSDVYSLACVAYELLTGKLPFEANGELALMLQHATLAVPPPSSVCPELPKVFDPVFERALAKNLAERTASVELFRRELLEAHQQGLEPLRILIAEDDQDFRDVLEIKLRLEFPGADIECVSNGLEALEALEKKPASAMVIDLQMPELDGVALTAVARSRPESATMPILVLTASGGAAEWKRLASMGADRFLVKPANLDDVALLLRQAIRERSGAPPPSVPASVPRVPPAARDE